MDVATDVLDLNCSVIESTPQWLSKLNEKLFEGVVKLEDELLI